jgi:serine/threonine protein phosphatase PrpC
MSDAAKLSFEFAAITDIGCERQNNEDSYGYDADHQFYVVCDGMGGRAAGEVASGLAVRTLIESFAATATIESVGEKIPIENRILAAITDANRAVREAGLRKPELQSMGTTLVCLCLDNDRAVVGNVGDSRAYLLRAGACQQITEDHSLLAEAKRTGEISWQTLGEGSNLQSIITRAVGVEDTVEADLYGAQLQVGDILMLASDGLTRYAQPEKILALTEGAADLATACQALIDHAKQCGGEDNITCILLRAMKPVRDRRAGNAQSDRPPDGMEAFAPTI